MNKNRSKFYFTLIVSIQILAYFFKIDRDVFAIQEYVRHTDQTFNEQPLSRKVCYFQNFHSVFSPVISSCCAVTNNSSNISTWYPIFLLYNAHVSLILKQQQLLAIPAKTIVSVLHKQNISHKSSVEEHGCLI